LLADGWQTGNYQETGASEVANRGSERIINHSETIPMIFDSLLGSAPAAMKAAEKPSHAQNPHTTKVQKYREMRLPKNPICSPQKVLFVGTLWIPCLDSTQQPE
jgi:hypothetical protein